MDDWQRSLARIGLVAKGISFAIVGALALKLALGDGGKATSREGALEQLARENGWGRLALGFLALGFLAYAGWRVAQAWRDDAWPKRLGYAGRAAIYVALAWSAAKLAVGQGGSGSQNERARETTDTILAWPGGTWLVGSAGAIVIGVGVWNLYRGLTRRFEDKWQGFSRAGSLAGVLGHCARFVVFGLIGVFAIKAARDFDPSAAVGFDGALQKLSRASYGPPLLGLTAAGLIAYGVYCLVDARYRDVRR